MARRRSAAALFEVIHADNRFPSRHGSSWSIGVPRWLRRRERADAAAAPQVAAEPVFDRAPRQPWRLPFSLPSFGMGLDPDRQVVSFKMSYTGALVAAFALLLALALAYVIGKSNGYRGAPALAELTSEDLRNGPVQANVLDITGGSADTIAPSVAMATAPLPVGGSPISAAASSTATSGSKHAGARPPTAGAAAAAAGGSLNEPKPPATFMETNTQRTVGLQYVLVQSYPPEEKSLAEETVKLLNSNGVLCTLETGLPYAPRWYCVVGVTGFSRVRNAPEYDAYVAKINQVGVKLSGTQKFFKRFENKPIKWNAAKGT